MPSRPTALKIQFNTTGDAPISTTISEGQKKAKTASTSNITILVICCYGGKFNRRCPLDKSEQCQKINCTVSAMMAFLAFSARCWVSIDQSKVRFVRLCEGRKSKQAKTLKNKLYMYRSLAYLCSSNARKLLCALTGQLQEFLFCQIEAISKQLRRRKDSVPRPCNTGHAQATCGPSPYFFVELGIDGGEC